VPPARRGWRGGKRTGVNAELELALLAGRCGGTPYRGRGRGRGSARRPGGIFEALCLNSRQRIVRAEKGEGR
jgi:hypothetical protein